MLKILLALNFESLHENKLDWKQMSLELSSSSIICSPVLIVFIFRIHVLQKPEETKQPILFKMKVEIFLFLCFIVSCFGVRLSPLENNDRLQDLTNLYVAEWQWESWPVKHELSGREGKSPGQRKNVALWRDTSKTDWYLFGGHSVGVDSKEVHSDIWKFTVKTRVWNRLFPPQGEAKGAYNVKKGERQTNLFDESNHSYFDPRNVVLCGVLQNKNVTTKKTQNLWSSLRRKKVDREKVDPELEYLTIYSPTAGKSSKVWQINAKEKLWTTFFCCCESNKNEKKNSLTNSSRPLIDKLKNINGTSDKSLCETKDSCSVLDLKINNAEDYVDNEQQHLNIRNLKNKIKNINQTIKINNKSLLNKMNAEKGNSGRRERSVNETKSQTSRQGSDVNKNKTMENGSSTKTHNQVKKEGKETNTKNKLGNGKKQVEYEKPERIVKIASEYCPEFVEGVTPIAWCDGKNGAFVAADVTSPHLHVWVFDLKANHWSHLRVNVSDEHEWPSCSTIRFAGNEEEVYIFCSPTNIKANESNKLQQNSPNPSQVPSERTFNTKLVYRINYKEVNLRSLGKIQLSSYFDSPEGEKVWQNNSLSVLEIIKNSENETILILAYSDVVDLWILSKNHGCESFDLIEKVWRGSALKWFDKYNSALYSLQFVSESGNSETILLPNPRNIEANEYWPRERGRFIIRIFKNENLKNQTFENRTREQNLTFQLLQSDYKSSGDEHQLNHMYSLKVLVFFGISLAIFSVFGFVIFLKRCVNCPPRIRVRNECHKFPVVIRYSVIPDDLLYPVA